jgi:hypothetical protein
VRLTAHPATGLQVTHRVAHRWHTQKLHAKAAADLLKQA